MMLLMCIVFCDDWIAIFLSNLNTYLISFSFTKESGICLLLVNTFDHLYLSTNRFHPESLPIRLTIPVTIFITNAG